MGNTVQFPFLKVKQVILRRRERGGSELPKPTNAVILDTHQWWRNREGEWLTEISPTCSLTNWDTSVLITDTGYMCGWV